jgi:hypothetical protein
MNFVDGRLQADDGRLVFVSDSVRVTLPGDRMAAEDRPDAITRGIRPGRLDRRFR